MPDPLDFPAPRPLTAEELADPVVQALLRVSRDPDAYKAAWDVLEPPTLPENVIPLDPRDRRP